MSECTWPHVLYIAPLYQQIASLVITKHLLFIYFYFYYQTLHSVECKLCKNACCLILNKLNIGQHHFVCFVRLFSVVRSSVSYGYDKMLLAVGLSNKRFFHSSCNLVKQMPPCLFYLVIPIILSNIKLYL